MRELGEPIRGFPLSATPGFPLLIAAVSGVPAITTTRMVSVST